MIKLVGVLIILIGFKKKYNTIAVVLVAGILGLTAGYCGTLMTPMAANFNILPAAILDMKNKNKVLLSQFPVAFSLLLTHIFLMYFWAF
ncbi:5-oxoproline transporter, DUF979 family subunit [Marinisporobacter balticus]|uniref:Uncharacterized protein DUF979 n=1 Tax=Marinisporobacter balticus TaxID=2018667 RepID=A0A4R2L0Z5_9FIRM|nr:uncharacterized protein DUF979 [Marinisporobacter balticus]